MSALFEQITAEIIAAIEAGAETFQMPWNGGGSCLPTNALTAKGYRATNAIALWAAALNAGHSSNTWATYRQWAQLGAQVRKGERGTTVVFWKIADQSRDQDADEDQNRRFIARASKVFNVAQVDGYVEPTPQTKPPIELIADAQAFFDRLPADLWHGGDAAFFDPNSDTISMPYIGLFRSAEGYYSVLAHEFTHWTGSKRRLARDLTGRFGSASYAMEELIAELGAAFICARLGIATVPRRDHAPYIASWLNVLGHDPRAIVTAASHAQAAADYIFGIDPLALTVSADCELEAA